VHEVDSVAEAMRANPLDGEEEPKGCLTPDFRVHAGSEDMQIGDIVYLVGHVSHPDMSEVKFLCCAQWTPCTSKFTPLLRPAHDHLSHLPAHYTLVAS